MSCGVGEDPWESFGLQGDPPVNPKGNKSWIFNGRTDAEAETPILWPPDVNWLIGKDPDAGKDWRQEEKGTTDDEMVGWPHWCDGHECEQAPGVGDGQGGLLCWGPWGRKEPDTTEGLNWMCLLHKLEVLQSRSWAFSFTLSASQGAQHPAGVSACLLTELMAWSQEGSERAPRVFFHRLRSSQWMTEGGGSAALSALVFLDSSWWTPSIDGKGAATFKRFHSFTLLWNTVG